MIAQYSEAEFRLAWRTAVLALGNAALAFHRRQLGSRELFDAAKDLWAVEDLWQETMGLENVLAAARSLRRPLRSLRAESAKWICNPRLWRLARMARHCHRMAVIFGKERPGKQRIGFFSPDLN